MALIKVKNPGLYEAWIEYLCRKNGVEHSDSMIRVTAFCKYQSGEWPPAF